MQNPLASTWLHPISLKYCLAFLFGAILPLAFAPFNFWPLAVVSPCLYLFLIDSLEKNNFHKTTRFKAQLLLSFYYWVGFYSVGVSWVYVSIHEYGYTAAPIAAFLALLFCAGLALVNTFLGSVYFKYKLHPWALLCFPGLWVFMEWSRSWFLTGFPWLYNGYAFIDSPLAGAASIGGVYLVSFLSISIATFLYFLIKHIHGKQKPGALQTSLATFTLLLIVTLTFAPVFTKKVSIDKRETLQLHLIQGNIAQHDKWLPQNQRKILYTYNQLIHESFKKIEQNDSENGHIIMLPEAAMPTLQSDIDWLFEQNARRAKELNTTIISGIFFDIPDEQKIFNSILATGVGSGLYHKQRLVPFGEYVPLETFIRGWIPFFDLPWSSFTRGDRQQEGLHSFGKQIAPFICYEILYPGLVFKQARTADFLITISNDAWFGNSLGPEQHFQMARMRALELGKYLVRTTNTGTTAIIGPDGKVLARLEKNQRDTLREHIHGTTGTTVYAKTGSRPWLFFFSAIFISGALLSFWHNKKATLQDQA